MDDTDSNVENFAFQKVKSSLVKIHIPFKFYKAVIKLVLCNKYEYLAEENIFKKQKTLIRSQAQFCKSFMYTNLKVELESKPIPLKFHIHKSERCE